MCEVKLCDDNWHPCKVTGRSAALDYPGFRFNVKLTEETVIAPKGQKPAVLKAGHAFLDCHSDCIRCGKNYKSFAVPDGKI